MNGYNRYKEKSIYSMSGPELLLLVYDEAIIRLSRAEHSLEDKNYKDFDDCINRVTKIVRYLTDILDMEQPIAWERAAAERDWADPPYPVRTAGGFRRSQQKGK